MDSSEFQNFRKKLEKTQKEMAHLLGVSVKAVRSYEQGWRSIPDHIQRQLLFLASKKGESFEPLEPCWIINKCGEAKKEICPAWEFRAGTLCWFLNGTVCDNGNPINWKEKIKVCQNCNAFPASLKVHLSK